MKSVEGRENEDMYGLRALDFHESIIFEFFVTMFVVIPRGVGECLFSFYPAVHPISSSHLNSSTVKHRFRCSYSLH